MEEESSDFVEKDWDGFSAAFREERERQELDKGRNN